MSPHSFLAAVLPPPGFGYYCVAELASKRKQHVFTEQLEDIDQQAEQWLGRSFDVYFALATFEQAGKREAANAAYIRSLFIDMDGYASKKEAAQSLSAFLETTGLNAFGTPWVVSSGGGLHCYWPFTHPVTVGAWRPLAERFKRLCMQEGLAIDKTVTADAARVLRVPGTMNYKPKYPTPRPVQVLVAGQPVDFDAFDSAVTARLRPENAAPMTLAAPALDLPGERPSGALNASAVKLMENATSRFRTILQRTSAGTGCAQLAHFVENAQADGMEPLWRAWLSEAKYCTDADKATVWLSKLHPYDPDRMQAKLREIRGPYPCIKFDSENPGLCQKCPHFGKITNPLALGREAEVTTEEREVVVATDPETPAQVIKRPVPPKGYMYGKNGGVYVEKIVEEADGTKRKQQVMILSYDLFVVDILSKDGEHTVHMLAHRPDKTMDVLIPQRYAVSKDELLKTLAQQNIIAAFGAGNDKNLFEYARACIEEASAAKVPVRIPAQYGWQEDGSFVYSGRVFFPDGRERTLPMPDLVNLTRVTRVKGALEEWRRLPTMLIKRELYDHLAVACIAFGSPLMRFTQMSALTFHAGSTDSGTGKSLALSLLNSVWGHPIHYRTSKGTSPVTMQQRMGNLNSLPFTSDEITHKSRQDMEWYPGFVFDASEGKGKEKSEVYHNRERVNTVSWGLLLFLTSNTHMHDFLSGARAHSSQGELMRMLEWTPETKLNWTPQEEDALRVLEGNYGIAGEIYTRWLVKNQETARRITQEAVARIKVQWKMSGDERFWAAGCGAVIAGAILASSKYAGVLDVPVDKIMESLQRLVEKARKVVKTGARSVEDVLNNYTRDNYGSFVVLKKSNGSLLAELGSGQAIDQTITRSKVMGRVEHEIASPGNVEYFIEEAMLKAHCVAMSFGYERFKEQIRTVPGYSVQFVRKDMMSQTRGPQMRVRTMCIRRPIDMEPDA